MRKINKILYRKIQLPVKIRKPVLALGSQTKNTVCFAKGGFAYISPVHPDLSSPQDYLKFEEDVKYFLRRQPKIIAFDLHPEYASTKYAQELSAVSYELRAIQHHHAHIASCMAENGLRNEKVIGVSFDGTGLGSDNKLWGAEFLICDYSDFKRAAHLKEIPLLGGERAILEPWRLVLAWGVPLKKIDKQKQRILKNMYLKSVNSPLTSSAGRLFDAAASLILEKYKANFEAELAIKLERIASKYEPSVSSYKFKIAREENTYVLDPGPMFKEIIADLKSKVPKEKIASRFHLTVAEMVRKTCLILRKETGINRVALSGGVFQNKLLLKFCLDLLYKEGFRVFAHKALSCNDSGISLGQAVIVGYRS